MKNFLFALIFVSVFFMCGCVSQTLKSQDYKAMLDAYKRQNMWKMILYFIVMPYCGSKTVKTTMRQRGQEQWFMQLLTV